LKIATKANYLNILNQTNLNIDFLIEEDHYPNQNKKDYLIYKILGDFYYEYGDYDLMTTYFQKSIDSLDKLKDKNYSHFYINWAEKEKEYNQEKSVEIYETVIDKHNRPNTSARVNLAQYYYENRNKTKALSILKQKYKDENDLEFFFYANPSFIPKIIRIIFSKINNDKSREAAIIQTMIADLCKNLIRDNKTKIIGESILKSLTNKIKNNYSLNNTLLNFHYKNNDFEEVDNLLKQINSSKFPDYLKIPININYQYIANGSESAIAYGEKALEKAVDERLKNRILKKLGDIYFQQEQWIESISKYQSIVNDARMLQYDYYAISLSKLNDKRAFTIFEKHFEVNILSGKSKHSDYFDYRRFTKCISSYINLCLNLNNYEKASKLISSLLKISTKKEYDNKTISFILQQQLKLTTDDNSFNSILKSSLNKAISNKQKAIIYSNAGRNLYYSHFDKLGTEEYYQSNRLLTINEISDYEKAINYFDLSLDLIPDSLTQIDKLKCLIALKEHDLAQVIIANLKNSDLIDSVIFQEVILNLSRNQLHNATNLTEKIVDEVIKSNAFYELAKSNKYSKEDTLMYFSKSLNNHKGSLRRIKYSAFLYSLGEIQESKRIAKSINNSANTFVDDNFQKELKKYKPRISSNKYQILIQEFEEESLPYHSILKKVNQFIRKNPYDTQLYELKIKILKSSKNYSEIDRTISTMISLNLLNNSTADILYTSAKQLFEYSDLKKSKSITINSQIKNLNKAERYIEYALKHNSENFDYLLLYSLILYKSGKHKKYNLLNTRIKKIKSINESDFFEVQKTKTKKIFILLWKEMLYDYAYKINFYKDLEKFAASNYKTNPNKRTSLQIFDSILNDDGFHRKNKYFIKNRILNRKAYHYYITAKKIEQEKGIKTALPFYGRPLKIFKRIYRNIEISESFLGGFLSLIDKLNEIALGIEVCEFLKNDYPSSLLFRWYGNYLKDVRNYKESYLYYKKAIDLSEDNEEKGINYHNILRVLSLSKENSNEIMEFDEMCKVGNKAYDMVFNLYPNFNHFDESKEFIDKICAK
jgi:tetratricopeptide (TPR) repeat protein